MVALLQGAFTLLSVMLLTNWGRYWPEAGMMTVWMGGWLLILALTTGVPLLLTSGGSERKDTLLYKTGWMLSGAVGLGWLALGIGVFSLAGRYWYAVLYPAAGCAVFGLGMLWSTWRLASPPG